MNEIFIILSGVLYGLLFGIIPTAGPTTALLTSVFFIPFFYDDPYLGIMFYTALVAACTTGDTWSSILLGIPGSSSSAATVIDGHPIAKSNRATLALTRLITGRTQVPGLRVLIEDDPLAWIFATDTFKWVFTWLGSMNLIALRTDGTPLATGIPPSVIWFIALAIITTWILMKTRYGNWIFASGGDKNGANNVGVPVGRVKISLFIGTAVAATIFATIQVLDAGSADTMRGTLKELEAIAAAVVGGCLLTGGYGSAIGAAFGALIFGTVSMGIFYTDVDTDWFKVFLGAMMLIAVIFNNYIRRKVTESK